MWWWHWRRSRRWPSDLPLRSVLRLGGLVAGTDDLGVQVLEGPRGDPTGLDEQVDIVLLEADDAPEAVAGDLPLVDESVQGSRGDAEVLGSFRRAQPVDGGGHD